MEKDLICIYCDDRNKVVKIDPKNNKDVVSRNTLKLAIRKNKNSITKYSILRCLK